MNCERKQPVVIGTDDKGEFIWGFIDMPRWQMEMFRVPVQWFSEFMSRWCELTRYEEKGLDFRADDNHLGSIHFTPKKQLAEMRRMYPRKKS